MNRAAGARRILLMAFYPIWVAVLLPLFGILIIAEWLGKLSYKRNRWA